MNLIPIFSTIKSECAYLTTKALINYGDAQADLHLCCLHLHRIGVLIIGLILDWLPSSNTCLVKHAYLYIAFNLLMAEFEYVLSIRREVNVTRKMFWL